MATTWWNQKPLDHAIEKWKGKVLREAAQLLEFNIEKLIAIQGVPVSGRSMPGHPPRRESGDLIRSWTYQVVVSANSSYVYSDIDYSYYLEVGAKATYGIILPRPYIRRALLDSEASLSIILTQPLP